MAYGTWYPFLGWSVFIIGFIVAIILFATKRKMHHVMYLVSICLYIFTAGFYIDVYNLGKNGILGVLALSALLFILMGWYFSKIFNVVQK
jgi:Na+/H+ antiporter NhaD/arsenite permease-like protein